MPKKHVTKSRKPIRVKKRIKKTRLHHKVISLFKGSGGMYVIFVLATIMAASFALTGGVLPQLNANPTASDQVTIDEDSAKQSSENALQLIDIKIKPTATPTPTPTNAPTATLTPTKGVTPTTQVCSDKVLIHFVLDLSASMDWNNKIGQLKTAMKNTLNKLDKDSNDVVVGVEVFSANASNSTWSNLGCSNPPSNGSCIIQPFSKLRSVKSGLLSKIDKLGTVQATWTRSAFVLARNTIESAQNANKFPGYKYNMVFISDGVPEIFGEWQKEYYDGQDVCRKLVWSGVPGESDPRCFSRAQDPREGTDISEQIKRDDVKVYSLGIYDFQSPNESDLKSELIRLMQDVASGRDKPYYFNAEGSSFIAPLLNSISNEVCK